MIGRPLREEAGLVAPVPPPDRDSAAPEPTPPELFGADAEGALDEAGAGEVLEQRGALACFAAEGMAGYGSGGGSKASEAGGGTPRGSYAAGRSLFVACHYLDLLVTYRAVRLRFPTPSGPAHPVVRGFDSPSESGTSGQPGHGADIDLAAPGPTEAGGMLAVIL